MEAKDAALLAAVLCDELQGDPGVRINPFQVADDTLRLLTLAKSIRRALLAEFNGKAQARLTAKRVRRYLETADSILSRYGATARQSGDVRGFSLLMMLPSGRSNSFTGRGWGLE